MIANPRSFHRLVFRLIFILVFGGSILLLISLAALKTYEEKHANLVYPNVYVNNIYVGGKTPQSIAALFSKKSSEFKNIRFFVHLANSDQATFSAQTLRLAYDGKTVAYQAYLIGRSGNILSKWYQQISSILSLKHYNFTTPISYNRDSIDDFIESSQLKYDKPARNALFQFENGKVTSFRQEEDGAQTDTERFYKDLKIAVDSLLTKHSDKSLTLHVNIIHPETTLAEANSFGIEELIGEGQSNYTHSIAGRIHNVLLAASKFNGVLIPKGKTFSFNDIVGDISALTGYEQAYIIKDGKTVLGDGGGVCQVSTTLFRAALNTGLPIIQRLAHAYRVSYYENDSKPGFDATVFSPYADLKIQNDTPASILIETEADEDNEILYFRLYGKKDSRKAEISNISLYDIQPAPPPRYQDDPTLPKGTVKQVDFAAGGAKAKFDYKVTKGDQTLFSQTFYSSYQPWQAVYLVGQGG